MKLLRLLSTFFIACFFLMAAFLLPMPTNVEQATAQDINTLSNGSAPDLIIESLTLEPPNPLTTEPVMARVRVRNQGDANANGFRTHLYIDPEDQPPTTNTPYTTQWGYFLTLPPGGVVQFEYDQYTFPESGCGHLIYAWVDRDGQVNESDETNNLSQIDVCVDYIEIGPDAYEPDDDCETQAQQISTDGTPQLHNLAPVGDADWVTFHATVGITYTIAAAGTGAEAQPFIDLLPSCDVGGLGTTSRIIFQPPATGWYYLRLANGLTEYEPNESTYLLTVQTDTLGIAPSITTIEPNEGNNESTTAVVITGTNFLFPPLVELCPYQANTCYESDCTQLLSIDWLTLERLEGTVPANLEAGQYCLAATNPEGARHLLSNAFTVSSAQTPTHTPTNTPTHTPTNTPTHTPTNTQTPTRTKTPTITPTNTTGPSPTATNTHTPGPSPTPSNTATHTPTNTQTATATNTQTTTPTNTITPSPIATNTYTPGPSPTPTNTPTTTSTHTPGPSPTPTHTPTRTSTHTPGPSPTPTHTPTTTRTHTPGPSPTPTHTPTRTSTQTPGPSPTPTNTPTNTPTPTHTPSNTPETGDPSEPNDSCDEAGTISINGSTQIHTFHDEADVDWLSFHATEAITVVIEARVPPTSTANVVLEVYESCESNGSFDDDDPPVNPDIRLTFNPPSTGTYYLRLSDKEPTTYGPDAAYHLSVRTVHDILPSGAVILVAGRLRNNDDLQDNIHHVTSSLYQFATTHGCTTDQIAYLATNTELDGVTGLPTKQQLQELITEWAVNKVGPDRTLTIYLMDHGDYDLLYLDEPNAEHITPLDLDGWLDELEASVPGVKSNIIVESCYSGSFIDNNKTVSAPGRVVISSTSQQTLAYASQDGATFSDTFIDALEQGMSLYPAFEESLWAARQGHADQKAWLDDNADSIYTPSDGLLAIQRGLACVPIAPGQNFPPNVEEIEVRNLSNSQGEIWAKVQDDNEVDVVWALVYPPSYQPPTSGNEMIAEPVRAQLFPEGDGWYAAEYGRFDEIGEYRLVVSAEDNQGLQSRPHQISVQTGWQLYLPMIIR